MRTALFAVFFFAAADATYAARGVIASHASLASAIAAFVVAMSVVATPLLIGASILRLGWARCGAALREIGRALTASAGGHGPLAAVTLAAALGIATTRATITARGIAASTSPRVGAMLIVGATLASVAAATAIAIVLLRIAGPRLVALEARAPSVRSFSRGAFARATLAVAVLATLHTLLEFEHVVAPAAAFFAWTIGGARVRSRGRAWRAVAVALVLVTFVAPHALARLPGRARMGVALRPPYGSLVLASVHRLVDRDGDGYSPILGGGDCDDDDPNVHPGARDVPGNGRDENCSGADATPLALPSPPPVTSRPVTHTNVVMIVMDALRPDRLGFGGNTRPTSPALDHFRTSATWFRRAYSPAPSTRFALASIFSGLDVAAIPQQRGPGLSLTIASDAELVAERLDRIGYDRVGFTIPVVTTTVKGIEQGFRVWKPVRGEGGDELFGHDAPRMTDAALEFLASTSGDEQRPYFLFAHYACTHAPYVRDARHDFGASVVDVYDGAVAYCDEHVGRLLAALDARADRDRTAVVVLSDHGELLGEHGLFFHGGSLLEPAVRSVLLVRAPGWTRETVDAPVTLTDLAPTILGLAGAPTGDTAAWDLAALQGDAPPRPIFLYADNTQSGVHVEARAVVDGRYKLVRDLPSGAEQLFDLESDPGETKSLKRALPDTVVRMRALLDAWDASR